MKHTHLIQKSIVLLIPVSEMSLAVCRHIIIPGLLPITYRKVKIRELKNGSVLREKKSNLIVDMVLIDNDQEALTSLRKLFVTHRSRENNIVVIGNICPFKSKVLYPSLRQHQIVYACHDMYHVVW